MPKQAKLGYKQLRKKLADNPNQTTAKWYRDAESKLGTARMKMHREARDRARQQKLKLKEHARRA